MICLSVLLSALLISLSGPSASTASVTVDDADGVKVMTAAALVLQASTIPSGTISVRSPDYAQSAGGAVFRRLADCIYGEEFKAGGSVYIQMVDFRGLTGNYRTAPALVGINLVAIGRKPRTRCALVGGDKGCSFDLQFTAIGASDIQRIVDQISFIQRTACPPEPAEPR